MIEDPHTAAIILAVILPLWLIGIAVAVAGCIEWIDHWQHRQSARRVFRRAQAACQASAAARRSRASAAFLGAGDGPSGRRPPALEGEQS